MSASLPRIKTVQELPSASQHVPKFRKLTLNSENQEERKSSLKTLKKQRLKSLSRYSTVQEQRQYKNQKIHLNLIERKLLNGTYDDNKETSNQLNALKQKRDHIKVETVLKTRQAERMKLSLIDIKKEIEELVERKGEYEKKMQEVKEKYDAQGILTQTAVENQNVLESMNRTRHLINLNLTKRTNDLKVYLGHLTNMSFLLDTELRESSQRLFSRQTKLQSLIDSVFRARNERNGVMSKHQQQIIKRKEDEQLQTQKSKEYMAELDHMDRLNDLKDFHGVYDKIMGHYFLDKYCKFTLINLHKKYQSYEYSYKKLCSYRSFQEDEPKTFVERFFEHEAQKTEREGKIAQFERYLEEMRQKNSQLKTDLVQIQIQELQHQEQLILSQTLLNDGQHQQAILKLDEEHKEAEEKISRIRRQILRLINKINKKGDRRSDLNEAALKNVQTLTEVVRAMAAKTLDVA